jgi:acetolactate synthase-1/2/3 large subunit
VAKSKTPCKPNEGFNRRGFLKGAAIGAATVVAHPQTGSAQTADDTKPKVVVPTDAQLAAEVGPSPATSNTKFIENPASDYMVDVIKALDIEYITTNPGSSFESLHESLINYGGNRMPEILTSLHEESAVAMAHGYAKIEGKPMAAMLHGSVGLLHGSMAIYNAYADRVPIFILVGNYKEPTGFVDQVHSAQDLGGFVRDFVKWDDNTISVNRFAQSALQAYKISMAPPMGPVVVLIDHDMQGAPLNRDKLRVPKLTMNSPAQGDTNAVREAARLLVEAENPLIMTGRSARTPEGIDLLVELAEILQAPVSGSERVNFPWTHPLYGNGGSDYQADVILGLEVNDMSRTARSARSRGARSISIASVELSHGSNTRDYGLYAEVDLNIAADAQATLPSLIEEVKNLVTRTHKRKANERGDRIGKAHAQRTAMDRENARYGWNSSPISTARLSAEIWAQIKDDDWSLGSWQGFVSGWPGKLWEMEKLYHYIGGHGAGGMGYSAPASVGAALANKKHGRITVNIQTDGDLNYAPGVLWTAVHHQIPLLTVMHNNRAYHAEVMYVQRNCNLHKRGEDQAHIGTTLTNPNIDYTKMAQGYGMHAEGPIESPNDLAPAIKRGLERVRAGEPALIDVITQPR